MSGSVIAQTPPSTAGATVVPSSQPQGWLPEHKDRDFPSRFADLKAHIIPGTNVESVTKAWNEVIAELAVVTDRFAASQQENIPSIDFSELKTLTESQSNIIRRAGCVVIRNVVNDDEALEWKRLLQEYVDLNPQVEGFPKENKQFFELYWSRPQLEARGHPNVLAVSTFLNEFFHIPTKTSSQAAPLVSLSTPLSFADRFRIRQPNPRAWTAHTPHIDGGSIEKWEDDGFREGCYRDILDGRWKEHDAYDMSGRLIANSDKYGRPNQCSVFRSWQGWLAMSNTGPGEGTLRLFPDILLSNAYLILRPFFQPIRPLQDFIAANKSQGEEEARLAFLAPQNWQFDNSTPDFPGIRSLEGGRMFSGQRLDAASHPHLRLDRDTTMISVPRVQPGDMVFWHCDAIHSVETYHNGPGDSSVMYIPAVPLTLINAEYILRQRAQFLSGDPGPDFPQNNAHGGESRFVKKGEIEHIGTNAVALQAMGLGEEPFPLDASVPMEQRAMREVANQMLYPQRVGAQK